MPSAGSLWHKGAGGAIPRIKDRYYVEKTVGGWSMSVELCLAVYQKHGADAGSDS